MSPVLLPFLLLGCWPYIGGSWVDNAPARATGVVSWVDYDGAGWVDNAGKGAAAWGWFQTPQDDFSTNWVLPAPTGCSDKNVDLSTARDLLIDLDGSTSVLSSASVDLPLTWSSESRVYHGSLFEGDIDSQATTWNLEETALIDGSLAVAPFAVVPGQIPYYGPDPGGPDDASLPELGLDQLEVTWSGDAADVVSVSGSLRDTNGNELEQWTCAAPGEEGVLSIPSDRWDSENVDAAKYIVFSVSHIVITSTAIDGIEAVSRGIGERTSAAVYTLKK